MSFITQKALIFRTRVRSNFLDTAKAKRMLGESNHGALYKAGFRIKQAAKKGIGNSAPHKPKARSLKSAVQKLFDYADGVYTDLTLSAGGGNPRPAGKPIKSWSPRRFVYYDIKDYLDMANQSVVIGPYRAPWLMRLHEFGGSEKLTAYVIGQNIARRAKRLRSEGKRIPKRPDGRLEVGYVRWQAAGHLFRGFKVKGHMRPWEKTSITKRVTYPKRPFMQGAEGVQKAVTKCAEDFRDYLHSNSQGGIQSGSSRTLKAG